jgi:hypothetical protein
MGIDRGLLQAMNDHKSKVEGPHFLFGVDNPSHPDKNEIKLDHNKVLHHLKGAGYDAHEVKGDYANPRKIIVYGVKPEQAMELHVMASKLGQESSIYSTGLRHEKLYHHGKHSGKKVQGKDVVWKQTQGSQITTLPGGQHHFSYNFEDPTTEEEKVIDSLDKAEKPDIHQYKKFADSGMDLMHMVTVKGQSHRPDINVPYHATIKLFDPEKDDSKAIHDVASKLKFGKIDPKKVHIEPAMLKGRTGYTMHVIKLHGPHAEEIEGHHKQFAHMGNQDQYEFHPHITVDEAAWNHIKNSGAKTAHEAGIEFHPPELRQGKNVLNQYKLHDPMKKGAVSHMATALGVAGMLAAGTAHAPEHKALIYDSHKMLQSIAQVESSGGLQTEHKALSGIHHGEHAYGKYGLTPNIIRETIHMHPELKQYKKAMMLFGPDLHRFMKDNPKLEDAIAQKHLQRLEHHFGGNPEVLGFAWNQGIRNAYKAIREKTDIPNHWHVKKIRHAYSGE